MIHLSRVKSDSNKQMIRLNDGFYYCFGTMAFLGSFTFKSTYLNTPNAVL